jgi:nucleotide-binding universal stress UspA family protein
MYKKIVVGTDLSETSKVAVEHAAALAGKLGAKLVLVHAGEDPGESLEELASSVGAEAVASPGNPSEVLLDESERLGADLLVVGSVGMSGARRFSLGNVPNKVSHHADLDLLIVKTDRGSRAADYRKILVGTDGSSTAMRAVEMASDLSNVLGIVPLIVTIYESPGEHDLERMRAGAEADAISAWSATRAQRETPAKYQWRIAGASQAEDVLERAAERASRYEVDAEVRAIEGTSPAEELLKIAESEDVDLICVGGIGMNSPTRRMLGNVPHRLSHHSPVDVLILQTEK